METKIHLDVSGASAKANVEGLITSGAVGIPVDILFSEDWIGLSKNVVCSNGSDERLILPTDGKYTVAPECLVYGKDLKIGVRGYNQDGTLVIPTVYAACGFIFEGTSTTNDPSLNPELEPVQKILNSIGDLSKLSTEQKDSLVNAINEVYEKGGTGGTSDYSKLSNKPKINGHELNGDVTSSSLGIKDGKDGVTPVKGVDYFTPSEIQTIENNAAAKVDVPTKTSDLQNDSGFLTEHQSLVGYAKEEYVTEEIAKLDIPKTPEDIGAQPKGDYISKETDPTVPDWAKQSNKPSYTATEVGALSSDTKIPTKTSDLQNDSGFITSCVGYEELSSNTAELKANTLYKFISPVTDLNITLSASSGASIYHFIFTTSSSGCNLSIPVEVKWDGGKAPELKADMKYEVSILDNVAVISGGAAL